MVRYDFDYELLNRARLAAGLSGSDLADRAGTPQTSLSDWLRGVKVPSSQNLGKVAGALGRDPGDFFRRVEEPEAVSA